MKTFKVATSGTSHLGAGRMFLIQADDEDQVKAWFAMNYGLSTIAGEAITEATTEDVLYYQSTHGRIHQTNARQRKNLMDTLDAVDAGEFRKALDKAAEDRKSEPRNLVLFRSGDDTSWYAVSDAIFDQIAGYPSEGFDGYKFSEFVSKLLFDENGDELPGVARFHTQDFVTEEVDLRSIKRIVTLPSY